MKTHAILVVALILAGQLSCTDENSASNSFYDDPSVTTLNGKWRVVSFEDFITQTVEHRTQENSWDKDIVITFNDTANPKTLEGNVTTNSVQAEFEYLGTRQFEVNKFQSTLVGQPEWANKFEAALQDNPEFKINRSQLRIYYSNNTRSVTLTKE